MMILAEETRKTALAGSPSTSDCGGVNGGSNCIVHTVTKYDTLAGVAIKYGVEVTDIKRLNGLVTDLQMFALKTLQIPLPGRHPPSPSLCNSHNTLQWSSSGEQSPSSRRRYSDIFDSFQSLKLTPSEQKVYCWNGGAKILENGSFSAPSLGHHRKPKSVANDLVLCKESENSSDRWSNKLLRRHKISVADFQADSNGISSRGLALRPKSRHRTVDSESRWVLAFECGSGVRESSSTSNLQDSCICTLLSLLGRAKWSLKADLEALSSATMPIFDCLPKPAGRRYKAAVD